MNHPILKLLLSLSSLVLMFSCKNASPPNTAWQKTDLLFEYKGSENWQSKWMLDGERSKIINSEAGMELIAGPEAKNDTCHTVLWTRQSFTGDICIEYEYTRTDSTNKFVNIIYFLATGEGSPEYPSDIALWNDKRVVPHMRTYFRHMNTYHISYAALSENGKEDYIRLRRYDPEKKGLKGTDIPEDYFPKGLFNTDVGYQIRILKFGDQIEMHIQNKKEVSQKLICKWDISAYPKCESGRIGLRHMYTRSARYKDLKVWQLASSE